MIRFLTYLFLFAASISLKAQQEGEVKPSEAKPLELPNYIIEGKGQVNVQSGVKQTPEKLNKLTRLELDSINSLKKEQTVLLPPKQLPSTFLNITRKHGFLNGEFGSFVTPSLSAGYEFNVGEYLFNTNGLFEISKGDADNSDYLKINGSIMAENVAADKFFIFGGSRTESNIDLGYNSYNLYAAKNPVPRNSFHANLGIINEGNYSSYDFSTGASFKFLNISTNNSSKSDNGIAAFLNLNGKWNDNSAGTGLSLDLHNYSGKWMNFIQLAITTKFKVDKLSLKLNGGIQLAKGSSASSLFNILLAGDAKYLISDDLTLAISASHSMENNNMQKSYEFNPYLSDSAFIDFNRITQATGQLTFHPQDYLSLSLGALMAYGSNTPLFVNADSNSFKYIYKGTYRFSVFSDGYYKLTSRDEFIYNARLSLFRTGNGFVTYDSPVSIIGRLRHNWLDNFSSSAGISFISKRFADIENNIELPSYFDLHFYSDYKLLKNWTLFIKINNILNQNIYIWNGFRERGLFLGAGINYIF